MSSHDNKEDDNTPLSDALTMLVELNEAVSRHIEDTDKESFKLVASMQFVMRIKYVPSRWFRKPNVGIAIICSPNFAAKYGAAQANIATTIGDPGELVNAHIGKAENGMSTIGPLKLPTTLVVLAYLPAAREALQRRLRVDGKMDFKALAYIAEHILDTIYDISPQLGAFIPQHVHTVENLRATLGTVYDLALRSVLQ